jgi:hypothetical protein
MVCATYGQIESIDTYNMLYTSKGMYAKVWVRQNRLPPPPLIETYAQIHAQAQSKKLFVQYVCIHTNTERWKMEHLMGNHEKTAGAPLPPPPPRLHFKGGGGVGVHTCACAALQGRSYTDTGLALFKKQRLFSRTDEKSLIKLEKK